MNSALKKGDKVWAEYGMEWHKGTILEVVKENQVYLVKIFWYGIHTRSKKRLIKRS